MWAAAIRPKYTNPKNIKQMSDKDDIQKVDTATPDAQDPKPEKKKRPIWVRILKWLGITLAALILLFAVICSLIVWILTPERLTPIVEEQASKYLNADVKIDRVELTFWSTFPKMTVDVDSLRLDSRSLDGLSPAEKAKLPADYRRLLELGSFHGGINVMPLLTGNISLYDVTFKGLKANLVQVNDSLSNYDIIPPSEEPSDTTPVSIPSISINRFEIADAAPIRYRSIADSQDITVALKNITLKGSDAPAYTLDINGNMHTPLLDRFRFTTLSMGAGGTVRWEREHPFAVTLEDFLMQLDEFKVTVNTSVDFDTAPMVNSFRAEFKDIPLEAVLSHVPEEFQSYVRPLKTTMRVSSTVELSHPWNIGDSLLPSLDAAFTIPSCTINYEKYRFNDVRAEITARFNGTDINASVFTVKGLRARGESLDIDVNALVTNVEADPWVEGDFAGTINLSQLPVNLKALIPFDITGRITGKTDFALHLSDLSREQFHHINAHGELNLMNLKASDPGMFTAYTRHARLQFGTDKAFVNGGVKVDSLLQVSLDIDTLYADGMGMTLAVSNFKAGVGASNRASSADTTEINPFGGKISVERLKFDAPADTMRVRLRNASVAGALRRFKGEGRSPLLDLSVDAGRLMFGQGLNKIALREAGAALNIHLNEAAAARRARRAAMTEQEKAAAAARRKARLDSLAAGPKVENIDLTLDRKDRNLMRRWDFSGHVTAKSGRIVTPYLPLRNRVRNFNMRFSNDSLTFRDVSLKMGQSDFTVNGRLSNLRRALTARRDNTLKLDLNVLSDTVNVNELIHALYAGPAIAARTDSASVWSDNDDIQQEHIAAMADTVSTGPLLLPHNIDAHLKVAARNIFYSDMLLYAFRGDLLLFDGALNLRNLSVSTDIGSIDLNGLYDGAAPDALQFGMGMSVRNFRLDRLTSIVPAIDTIMPMMKNFAGIVNAEVAVTTDLHPNMDINIPTLKAALSIQGDSLVLLDPATFRTVSKWLLFRNKKRNMIDHMEVEAIIDNSMIEVFPFIFNIDRYRLGVMGNNDLAMNMNYHVSVLKSPIPFKFGINLKGNTDKMKIRLGGAKVKPGMVGERQQIADNTRINLVEQINTVFHQGLSNARKGKIRFPSTTATAGAREASNALTDDALSPLQEIGMSSAGVGDDSTVAPQVPTPLIPVPTEQKKKK